MSPKDDVRPTTVSNITNQGASQPLAMTDWTVNVERISTDRDTLLWEMILHSFLREEILIQDEALAQSEQLAEWFGKPEDFVLLDELFDLGQFIVITRKPETYPEQFRELARVAPIEARARHIAADLAKHGKPFELRSNQLKFYSHFDALLRNHPNTHRPFKERFEDETHLLFKNCLSKVLRDKREKGKQWLGSEFGLNDPKLVGSLASCVEDPEKALRAIKNARLPHNRQVDKKLSQKPLFTRTLGHYLAATLPAHEDGINFLIHSAYAAAFCHTQGGTAGRYGKGLTELLPPSGKDAAAEAGDARAVRLQCEFDVSLKLPELKRGFANTIREVNEQTGGRLRESLMTAGKTVRFDEERKIWNELSGKLARGIAGIGKEITVRRLVGEIIGKGSIEGAAGWVIEGISHVIRTNQLMPRAESLKALGLNLSAAAALNTCKCYIDLWRLVHGEEELRIQLKSLFPLRFSDVPLGQSTYLEQD